MSMSNFFDTTGNIQGTCLVGMGSFFFGDCLHLMRTYVQVNSRADGRT